jgi:cellulose synthase/poly-beta-1,6-N-acetylglucosamine synthase-like glycosyltransferase
MRLTLMRNLKTAVGICAYNEEHNIRFLLDSLTSKQDLPADCKILVVCSGCTDGTIDVVRQFQAGDKRVQPIVEETRSGKANALNQIFAVAKSSADVLILVNADALPEHGSINKLLKALEYSDAGVVFAQPVPFECSDGVSYRIVKVVWRLHHLISRLKTPKLSGELCAIRTSCIQSIPKEIATDEPFIELVIRQQGYKISYLPDAIVRIRCPTNIADLFKHRKRIWIGHLQLKQATGFDVSTTNFKYIFQVIPKLTFSEVFFAFLGAFIELIAYYQAKRSAVKEKIPYMWEPIKSTKNSIRT